MSVHKDEMPDIPDCGIAFATLAAAERLLVLGEPVGALLVVSYIRGGGKKTQVDFTHKDTGGSFLLSCEPKLGRKK